MAWYEEDKPFDFDVIEFKPAKFRFGRDEFSSTVADIYINGKRFLDAVYGYERQYIQEDNLECEAGEYCLLSVRELYENLYQSYKDEDSDYAAVFGCSCGCTECQPFYTAIDVGRKVAVWFDFYGEYRPTALKYNEMRRYIFGKEQYFSAVARLGKMLD